MIPADIDAQLEDTSEENASEENTSEGKTSEEKPSEDKTCEEQNRSGADRPEACRYGEWSWKNMLQPGSYITQHTLLGVCTIKGDHGKRNENGVL